MYYYIVIKKNIKNNRLAILEEGNIIQMNENVICITGSDNIDVKTNIIIEDNEPKVNLITENDDEYCNSDCDDSYSRISYVKNRNYITDCDCFDKY